MGNDFGIRFGNKTDALASASALFKFLIIFDDAVMDQQNFFAAVKMRMGIDMVGAPCVAQRVWEIPRGRAATDGP